MADELPEQQLPDQTPESQEQPQQISAPEPTGFGRGILRRATGFGGDVGTSATTQAKRAAEFARKVIATARTMISVLVKLGPVGWVILGVFIAIILFILGFIIFAAFAGIDKRSTLGTSDTPSIDERVAQIDATYAAALAQNQGAIDAFFKNPTVLNAQKLLTEVKKMLDIKDRLPQKEKIVPLLEELSVKLETWEDATPEQKKRVFQLLKEIRTIPSYGCDRDGKRAGSLVLASGKIKITNSLDRQGFITGKVTNIAGQQFPLNAKMPCLLLFLADNGFAMANTVVAREHLITTFQTNASAHAYGNAIDIFNINNVNHPRRKDTGNPDENNVNIPAFTQEACKMLKFLKDNMNTLKQAGIAPKQTFGPADCADDNKAGYSSFGRRGQPGIFAKNYLRGHNSHVHLGF